MSSIAGLRTTLLPPEKIAAKLEGLKKAEWILGTSPQEGFRYYLMGDKAVAFDIRNFKENSNCLTIYSSICPDGAMFDFDANGNLEDTAINVHKVGSLLDGVLREVVNSLSAIQQVSKSEFSIFLKSLSSEKTGQQ